MSREADARAKVLGDCKVGVVTRPIDPAAATRSGSAVSSGARKPAGKGSDKSHSSKQKVPDGGSAMDRLSGSGSPDTASSGSGGGGGGGPRSPKAATPPASGPATSAPVAPPLTINREAIGGSISSDKLR
jgi:hypothetical protein